MPAEGESSCGEQVADVDRHDRRIGFVDGQARQDRGPDARGDQRLSRRARAGLRRNAQPASGAVQMRLDQRHHRPVEKRDERSGADLAQGGLVRGERERRPSPHDQDAGIVQERGADHRRGAERQLSERGVELTLLDPLEMDAVAAGFVERDLQPGMARGKVREDRRRQPSCDADVDPDPQVRQLLAAAARRERAQVGLSRLQLGEDPFRVVEQQQARVRQQDRGGVSATAVHQPSPHDRLQLSEALAHRGLNVSEPIRGSSKRALLVDRDERREMAQLDAAPALQT